MGEWEVNQAENTLCSGDQSVRLEPRVMDVLVYLAAEPGRVVSKEDLLAVVWGGAFVEEGALVQAVHSLRKFLGDDARQPKYIQTISKRGYRILAPVELEHGAKDAPSDVFPVAPSGNSSSSIPALKRRLLVLLLAVAAAVALVLVAGHRDDGIRIVVLPFETLEKPEDPYFAAGLTEEITTNLTLLPTVQVIPGKNALGDEGVAKPISEIGEQLGVDYVLRGNVSWHGGQVRVTTKLIKVADETIVPASPFVGDASNPFTAQQEISRAIISILNITLTPEQNQTVGERSTRNPEAYRAYIEGLVLKDQPYYSPSHLEGAAQAFEQAVRIDPKFAEAWAELSQVHSYLAFNTHRTTDRSEQARRAMKRAVALGPHLLATRLAQGYFSYRCLEDYGAALQQLTAAAQAAPNSAEVLEMRGLLLRRTGQFPEAIEVLKNASALNPRTADLIWTIAETYRALREHEQADAYFQKAISLAPDVPFYYEQRALNRFSWTGNPREARSILENSPVPASPQLEFVAFHLDLYERRYQQAFERLSLKSVGKLPLPDQSRLATLAAIARQRTGDHLGAIALADANLSVLRLRIKEYPRSPMYRAYLAVALAQLGRSEEALEQAELAVRKGKHDKWSGPRLVEIQATVDMILGRHQEAFARLSWLLSTYYRGAICVAELRLNPVWDPLRGHDEFRKLLTHYD